MAIAHRGASAEWPENTVPAFTAAVRQGAGGVEFDLRMAADGQFVVCHDHTVERTTDGQGLVATQTSAELRQLDAGRWKDPRHAGLRIPTLDEALDAIAPALPVIELKVPVVPAALGAALDRHGQRSRALIISFIPGWLATVRHYDPQIRVGLLAEDWRANLVGQCRQLSAGVLILNLACLSLARVEESLDAGLEVWCYTANDVATIAACAAMGITGIITDRPDLIRAR